MNTHRFPATLLVLVALLPLVSCVGGGSGGTGYSGGGVGGTGIISRGSISEFGSIVVNGTEFDTTNAVLVVDGVEIGTGDMVISNNLDRGRVVTVQGMRDDTKDGAVATHVIYRSDVEGPVLYASSTDSNPRQLTVMGQTVMVNYLTHLKNVVFEEISQGDVVDVSGFYDDEGIIWATFLERTGTFAAEAVYEVKGFVDALDPQQKMFMINDIEVDYSAADTSGLPGGQPVEGLLVEAEGTVDQDFALMTASLVVKEDEIGAENAEEVEINGFVTYLIDIDEFVIGNQLILVEDGTVFVDGLQDDIATGKKIEAEGELVDGILRAWEIEFWEPDQFEIEGPITHIEFINFVNGESEFTIEDQVVVTSDQTAWEDGDLADLDLGVNVEIKGRMVNDDMVADKVSFELGDI